MKLPEDKTLTFPTSYKEILKRIDAIDPLKYRASRNYINGAVSYLSPYISRGVISTKFIFDEILKKGHHPQQAEKFIQELAWRDYWQQVWIAKGEAHKPRHKAHSSTCIKYRSAKSNLGGCHRYKCYR